MIGWIAPSSSMQICRTKKLSYGTGRNNPLNPFRCLMSNRAIPSTERNRIIKQGISSLFHSSKSSKPLSSEVLSDQLRQREYPHWTAWYVPRCDAQNDLWGKSHFNFDVDGRNYHVLRTGAFPFIKFHCSMRPIEDLIIEDYFYRTLKVFNLGLPTLAYGIAGLFWTRHKEVVTTSKGNVTVYFWYQETKNARF